MIFLVIFGNFGHFENLVISDVFGLLAIDVSTKAVQVLTVIPPNILLITEHRISYAEHRKPELQELDRIKTIVAEQE